MPKSTFSEFLDDFQMGIYYQFIPMLSQKNTQVKLHLPILFRPTRSQNIGKSLGWNSHDPVHVQKACMKGFFFFYAKATGDLN